MAKAGCFLLQKLAVDAVVDVGVRRPHCHSLLSLACDHKARRSAKRAELDALGKPNYVDYCIIGRCPQKNVSPLSSL